MVRSNELTQVGEKRQPSAISPVLFRWVQESETIHGHTGILRPFVRVKRGMRTMENPRGNSIVNLAYGCEFRPGIRFTDMIIISCLDVLTGRPPFRFKG